jgi:hypothetical protein
VALGHIAKALPLKYPKRADIGLRKTFQGEWSSEEWKMFAPSQLKDGVDVRMIQINSILSAV